MYGWHGKILRLNLSKKEYKIESFNEDFAKKWIGGRGFAAKILWDELKPGIDPLGPENKLVVAAGPLTGFSLPSSSKLVVAAKSPLTGGYGDGNLGTRAATNLRKTGFDAIVIEGKADEPTYVSIENDTIEFHSAKELWGLNYFDLHHKLEEQYGKTSGILGIGRAGEKLVKFATIRSEEGRSGGRPGIGAVMGSKNLKAIVIKGSLDVPVKDPETLKDLGSKAYNDVKKAEAYEHWMNEGTTMVLAWCNETSTLPVKNFTEAQFELADKIDGEALHALTIARYGCPRCNMRCGLTVHDLEKNESELDYENIGMLGSNLGIGDMAAVASLNRIADDYGMDTISLGSSLGFYAEASQKGLVDDTFNWGDVDKAIELAKKTGDREGPGDFIAEGTMRMAEKLGGDADLLAINVKGLEASAYNCNYVPGMALAFGTSSIGAHHKDAWVIWWEVHTDRDGYGREKAEKVIELQRIRGGLFEVLVNCRFPWIELGLNLDYYVKFLKAVTGIEYTFDQLWEVGDRIYALIRAFWVREFNDWNRKRDYPPRRWFEQQIPKGPLAGKHLDPEKYDSLLSEYYDLRGWDERGIPTKDTFKRLGLEEESKQLEAFVTLK